MTIFQSVLSRLIRQLILHANKDTKLAAVPPLHRKILCESSENVMVQGSLL